MGVDLTLLPFDSDADGSSAFSHTVLDVERRRELWTKVQALPSLPVPKGFTSYFGEGADGERVYGETQDDSYANPIKATTAGELSRLWMEPEVRDNHKNRAIWDYLAALPPETRVALYWH